MDPSVQVITVFARQFRSGERHEFRLVVQVRAKENAVAADWIGLEFDFSHIDGIAGGYGALHRGRLRPNVSLGVQSDVQKVFLCHYTAVACPVQKAQSVGAWK